MCKGDHAGKAAINTQREPVSGMRPGEASSAPVEYVFPFASWFSIPDSSAEVAYSVEAN